MRPQVAHTTYSEFFVAPPSGIAAANYSIGTDRKDEDRRMQPLKLLVVEDDLASLELMTEVFTSLKAEVRPISDSEKAVTAINQERFDGIFLDLEMPNLNGFDLARLVRKSSWNKSTPIIIVTGRDERQTMRESFAIGATFFLQKPVDRQKAKHVVPHRDWRHAGKSTQIYTSSDQIGCDLHGGS